MKKGPLMSSMLKRAAVGVVVSLAFAFNVQADVTNPRPYVTPSGDLSALQSTFTSIGATSIDVDTDQSSAAIFRPTGFGVSAGSYVANVTWETSIAPFEIGLYEFGDITNKVTLFGAGAPLGSRVSFTFFTNGNVSVFNADNGDLIDSATGFGLEFGLYFDTTSWPSGGVFYTEDSENGGDVQALIYEGQGDNVTVPTTTGNLTLNDVAHWYVAWEGLPNTGSGPYVQGSFDFNDAVVMLESVTPVPEPETYAMLLAGLGLMAFVARRRRKLAIA